MSRRRDWDKVGRERRAYENGTLPFWWDGWPAGDPTGFSKRPDRPANLQIRSSQKTGPAYITHVFDPHWDLDRKALERLFAMKLPLDLSIRVREIRFVCPQMPIEIRSWIFQPIEEDPTGRRSQESEIRLRTVTKLISVRIRGFQMRLGLEYRDVELPHTSKSM
jgi:hypothetical protein